MKSLFLGSLLEADVWRGWFTIGAIAIAGFFMLNGIINIYAGLNLYFKSISQKDKEEGFRKFVLGTVFFVVGAILAFVYFVFLDSLIFDVI